MAVTATEADEVALSSPTMRMRQLGAALQQLREAAGKTQVEAAEWIDLKPSALSRIENGTRRAMPHYVRNLCELYGVDIEQSAALQQLASEAKERGWWAQYGSTVPRWFEVYLGMETDAQEAWDFSTMFVPGILQSERYIDVVSPGDAKQVRLERQKRLTSDADPLTLRAILDQAVVERIVGDATVMQHQIRHLMELSALANVTLQLLPFGAGAYTAVTAFTALRFPDHPMNTIYVEIPGGAVYHEKPADVHLYTKMFNHLSALALDEAKTLAFLEHLERRCSK